MKKIINTNVGEVVLTWETNNNRLFIEAITPKGFNLANIHYGIIRSKFDLNPKLRSEKSKNKEINDLIESISEYISKQNILDISQEEEINVALRNEYALIDSKTLFNYEIQSHNFKNNISWYNHDVYNRGDFKGKVIRNDEGQLEFYMTDKDLYDFNKLEKLYNSDNFKNRKYAFFFYGRVEELLGKEKTSKGMSGLLPKGESLL